MEYFDVKSLPFIMKDFTPAQERKVVVEALMAKYNMTGLEDVTEEKVIMMIEDLIKGRICESDTDTAKEQ